MTRVLRTRLLCGVSITPGTTGLVQLLTTANIASRFRCDLSDACVFFTFSSILQGSPSGCVRREIPGVTQVEKGHERNTAVVVTADICWRKHGIYLS